MDNDKDCNQGNLLIGVNKVTDPANPSNLEKRHIPIIVAPEKVGKNKCFEVILEVGKNLPHPNECSHFIQFIDLYADDTFLSRVNFTAAGVYPKVNLCISLQSPVKQLLAYAHCNIHGTWVGAKAISVGE